MRGKGKRHHTYRSNNYITRCTKYWMYLIIIIPGIFTWNFRCAIKREKKEAMICTGQIQRHRNIFFYNCHNVLVVFHVWPLFNTVPHLVSSLFAHISRHNSEMASRIRIRPRPETLVTRAGRAFLDSRSRVPGALGTREPGNAIFFKHAGTQNAKK